MDVLSRPKLANNSVLTFLPGFLLLATLQIPPVVATEIPGSGTPQTQASPSPPPPAGDRPAEADQTTPPATPAPTSETRRDDRVYISEIYPEYCRSYFSRRDWVSLFEYREGMYRCLYGNDRGFWR
ncbi:MAG: hypothetical protein NW220_24240 [Leptolyngbyaceae cyanobacterium bins.349]|nr:hypothetical protein [Leptolyngbyaceae cyanobacterium bins.349]